MATSGTFATFDIMTLLEEAYERAGLELKSGYDLRTGIRSFNFLMAEWANKGLNMWTIEQETEALVYNQAAYTLEANTVDVIDVVLRNASNTDITLERLSETQYSMVPDKTQIGTPNSYYVQRLNTDTPIITLWQVPSDATQTLVYWRLRRIEEAGSVYNTPDVPFRFIPPLVSGLAFQIAMKKNQSIAPALKVIYEEDWNNAADEDRDRASVFFYPDVTD